MIIFEPYTRATDRDTIEVRARIQLKQPPPDGTEELVFEYPARFADWVSPRSDGFVAALVRASREAYPARLRRPMAVTLEILAPSGTASFLRSSRRSESADSRQHERQPDCMRCAARHELA